MFPVPVYLGSRLVALNDVRKSGWPQKKGGNLLVSAGFVGQTCQMFQGQTPWAPILALGAIGFVGCPDDPDKVADVGISDQGAEDVGVSDVDGSVAAKDADFFVYHDAGGPAGCNRTCDCPQGQACVSGECRALGTPVWCCNKEGCPTGQQCLGLDELPDVCAGDPGPRDGGPREIGAGNVGDYCEEDTQCDQAQGLTCWERTEVPFIWGYCSSYGCMGSPGLSCGV